MLEIHQSAYDQLRQHAEAAYPNECCGILIGTATPAARTVTQAIPVPNTSATPKNHYQIHPTDLIRAQKSARQHSPSGTEEEILGFYHSHPDHPAAPSATDLAEAHWLGSSYVITCVQNGQAAKTRSFALAGRHEEDKHFLPEEIAKIPSAVS
jgi:proteasome lid subunit RPN8/RPN11